MSWYAVDVTLAAHAREAVEYALMEAGATGTEASGEDGETLRVSAYFDAPPQIERVREALGDALRVYGLATSDVREMSFREVAETDWLAEWKKNWQPVEVGKSFLVAPPWSEVGGASGRILIRIEPGMAFGTGTHETTRLCLVAIEKHFTGGSFLDVGTGTGILAIAAAKLCRNATIDACDTDAAAVTIAHENARLNGVAERINFRTGTVAEDTPSADVVCANLTADVIIPLLPALLGATCERLILSGILETQSDAVRTRLGELGVERSEIVREGEWVAMII
ncbi:MAG TPA: 50S ribosomal protein L11 methyltransferase [Pyrinomonadaceae bacterium]|jgi:ribosomal protein L11 methyltransferase|nr:50S ribosomal protein L11 methyltransferase [Pyrinomonadaceae bacterium]